MTVSGNNLQDQPAGAPPADAPDAGRSNRPGQAALRYRIGTHPIFLRRMLARLQTRAALSTREPDDVAVALLDACAVVVDVLTFYQERIANEGYLRTAVESRSLRELARMLGYELSPGVAAGVLLAFTVEDAAGAPGGASVPQGTRVLSIPGQGRLPQTFETSADLEARAEWNALRPRLTEPQQVGDDSMPLYISGVTTQLQPGDLLLFERGDSRCLGTVREVRLHPAEGSTWVAWKQIFQEQSAGDPAGAATVYVFRQRAALFGHNAPDWRAMPKPVKDAYDPHSQSPDEWPNFALSHNARTIDLDAAYPRIVPGSWIVLIMPDGTPSISRVVGSSVISCAGFTLAARATQLSTESAVDLSQFNRRQTAVYAQGEALDLAEQPIADNIEVGCTEIMLDRHIDSLQPGQLLALSGTSDSGEPVAEIVALDRVEEADGRTALYLQAGLQHTYVRASMRLNANLVRATHGETVHDEVLGSGDGSQANQRFRLARQPLTYVADAQAGRITGTLAVYVNGVLWQEVPSLYQLGPRDRGYIVRVRDDGKAEIIFGDGERGARLPSGSENVVAGYRSGIGPDGEVETDKLILLQTRPLGIRAVTNPLPSGGAAPPETPARARVSAPLTVRTLDRIISLRDVAEFARAFPGIDKAQAVELWAGGRRLVHLTVAGTGGAAVDPVSDLYRSLARAIEAMRAPGLPLRIDSYEPLCFNVAAAVRVEPGYQAATVFAAVQTALRESFAFDRRDFGQGVAAAEVITVIQQVPGIAAVDLNLLYVRADDAALSPLLEASPAAWDASGFHGAQLLLINVGQGGITITEMDL